MSVVSPSNIPEASNATNKHTIKKAFSKIKRLFTISPSTSTVSLPGPSSSPQQIKSFSATITANNGKQNPFLKTKSVKSYAKSFTSSTRACKSVVECDDDGSSNIVEDDNSIKFASSFKEDDDGPPLLLNDKKSYNASISSSLQGKSLLPSNHLFFQ